MDITVRRNAFGRQVHSFEAPVELRLARGRSEIFPGVFIRAPWVEEVGERVEVIATLEGHIVGVRQDHLVGIAFHPELTEDDRVHEYFLDMAAARAHQADALSVGA